MALLTDNCYNDSKTCKTSLGLAQVVLVLPIGLGLAEKICGLAFSLAHTVLVLILVLLQDQDRKTKTNMLITRLFNAEDHSILVHTRKVSTIKSIQQALLKLEEIG